MGRTAGGEQWGVRVFVRARKPGRLSTNPLLSLFVIGLLAVSVCCQEASQGLDTMVQDFSAMDQKLPEVIDLLATLGGVNINVAGTVQKDLAVNVNVKTPKTIRQVLDDLATQYNLWVDYQPDNILIRPASERPIEKENLLEKAFQLRFSKPSDTVDLVRNFLSDRPEADAIALDTQKAIIVRDIPEALARIEEFLNRIDIPQQSAVFKIMYGDAEAIADIIRERIPDLEADAITVDTANSQLIVKTTLENLQQIQLLIETLDVKKEIRVFQISFHEVEDVIGVLEDLNLLSPEASLVANEYTGRLIIQDTVERLDRMAEVIEAYDTPRPAVFVEAEIMEIGANYNFAWDPTINLADAAQIGSVTTSIQDGQSIINLAGSGAFNFAYLDAGSILAQLQAREGDNEVENIASPRVLVEMKEEARLNVGSEEPIGVRSFRDDIYTGGSRDIVTQRVREVGIRLIIFARNISDKGYVELEVGLENSTPGGRVDIGGDTQGLRVNTQNIETVAVIKDGRTLALGGLLSRQKEEASGGVPFLSRVPVARYFFSNLSRTDNRRKLLLFVTPHILNVDRPLSKFMQDDDALVNLHRDKGDLSLPEKGSPDTNDHRWSIKDEPQWIKKNGRWGYIDKDGQFVDRTEMYLSAYGDDEAEETADLQPVSSKKGNGSSLLQQLDEIGATAIPRPIENGKQALVPDRSEPKAMESVPESPAPTNIAPIPAVPTPPVEPTAPSTAPQQPSAAEPLVGEQAMLALNNPAGGIGTFNGTLRQLIEKVRNDTQVRFSISGTLDQSIFDQPVTIDATGKTYQQVLNEALSGKGMNIVGREGRAPQILRNLAVSAPAAAPVGAPPTAAPSQPAPPTAVEPPPAPPTAIPQAPPAPQSWAPVREDGRRGQSISRTVPKQPDWPTLPELSSESQVRYKQPASSVGHDPWKTAPSTPLSEASRLPARQGSSGNDPIWDSLLEGVPSRLEPVQQPKGGPIGFSRHTRSHDDIPIGQPDLRPPDGTAASLPALPPNNQRQQSIERYERLKDLLPRNK